MISPHPCSQHHELILKCIIKYKLCILKKFVMVNSLHNECNNSWMKIKFKQTYFYITFICEFLKKYIKELFNYTVIKYTRVLTYLANIYKNLFIYWHFFKHTNTKLHCINLVVFVFESNIKLTLKIKYF